MLNLRTGDKLVLSNVEYGHDIAVVLELIGSNLSVENHVPMMLARAVEPYKRMHLSSKGIEFKSSTPNRDNMLMLEQVCCGTDDDSNSSNIFIIRTQSPPTCQKDKTSSSNIKPPNCLAMCSNGDLICIPYFPINSVVSSTTIISTEYGSVSNLFVVNQCNNEEEKSHVSFKVPRLLAERKSATAYFRKWQLRRFINEGYIQLPGIIARDRIDHCVTYLTHHMGQVGCLIPGGVQGKEYGKFPGQISNGDVIRNLILKTNVLSIIEELLGCDVYQKRSISAQIAFRYPQFPSEEGKTVFDSMEQEIEWHTDGYRQGHGHPFSVLVGISLSDVEKDFEGNLSVWPGSHFLLHRCRNSEHGGLDLEELCKILREEGRYSDLFHPSQLDFAETLKQAKVDEVTAKIHDNSSSILPCIGKPVQVRTKPGDIVLLHPDLAHGGAPNYSPAIRQMLYFRLKVDHGDNSSSHFNTWDEVVLKQQQDLWVDYLGLKTMIGEDELALTRSIHIGT